MQRIASFYILQSNLRRFYHFIMPDPMSGGSRYDIKVFTTSPLIQPLFHSRFPDTLGIPTDSFCHLSATGGVGIDQGVFYCKTADIMARDFEKAVKPLLTNVAIPFLDHQRSINQMVPFIRHPLYKALIAGVLNEPSSRQLLSAQLEKFGSLSSSDEVIVSSIERIRAILANLNERK